MSSLRHPPSYESYYTKQNIPHQKDIESNIMEIGNVLLDMRKTHDRATISGRNIYSDKTVEYGEN